MKHILRNLFISLIIVLFFSTVTYAVKNNYKTDSTNKIISYIEPQTTIKTFKEKLGVEKVYKDKTAKEQVTNGSIGTGMSIKNDGEIYELSVIGDFDGDGNATQVELSKTIRYIVGKTNLTNLETKSADFTGDDIVDQRDITKFIRYIVYGELKLGKTDGSQIKEYAPTIEITASTLGWTNDNVTITATATDKYAQLSSYQFSTNGNLNEDSSGWESATDSKTSINANYTVENNGVYYFYVKNDEGDVYKKSIEINKINRDNPIIEKIEGEQDTFEDIKLAVTVNDQTSGISKINVNYKKQEEQTYQTKETEYKEMNGQEQGETGTQIGEITLENLDRGTYDIYIEVYNVAGNKIESNIFNIIKRICVATVGDEKFESIQDAIDSIENSSETTIVLQKDTTENIVIDGNKDIILDLNGHSITGETSDEPTIKVEEGSTLTLINEGKIISENGIAIENNGEVNVNGDIDITGDTENVTVKITFESVGGGDVESIEEPVNTVLEQLPTTAKVGYTFDGWYTAQTEGTKIEEPFTMKKNAKYYAQWTANKYTITYDINGGDGGETPDSIHTVDQSEELTENGFTKKGYTFIEWNSKANGNGRSYSDKEKVKNLATSGTVTLYAIWADITGPNIEFTPSTTAFTNEDITLTINAKDENIINLVRMEI